MLAAVAAVLGDGVVSFVDVAAASLLAERLLPAGGVALFAAPDGRVLVPLEDRDATAVIAANGTTLEWPGRIFPLFFDEYDRMVLVLPGEFAILSYPERVPLVRGPLPLPAGAWRAACSHDGRVVAVVSADDRRRLLLFSPYDPRVSKTVTLQRAAVALSVAPDGSWVAVAEEGGSVELRGSSGTAGTVATVGGEIRAVAVAKDAGTLVLAVSDGGRGRLVGLAVRGPTKPLKTRFTSPLDEEPLDVAVTERQAIVVSSTGVKIFDGLGRRPRTGVALAGGWRVVVVPTHVASVVPDWGDGRER